MYCNSLSRRFITGPIVLLTALPFLTEARIERSLLQDKVCDMNGTCSSRGFTITSTGRENEVSQVVFDVAIKIDSLREDYESSGLKKDLEKALCDYQDWGIERFCGKDENIKFQNCTITDVVPSDATDGSGVAMDGASPFVYDRRVHTIEYSTFAWCGEYCPINALPGQDSIDSRMLRTEMQMRMCQRFLIHFLNEANLTDSATLEVIKDELVADKCDSFYASDPFYASEFQCLKSDTSSSAAAKLLCFQLIFALLCFLLFIA